MNYNEMGEGGPPDRLGGSTGFLLAWVSAQAGERYGAALAAEGLNAHHVGVLTLLTGGPMPQSRLSERLGVFKPAMVGILRDLEGMGLVQRSPHPTDRRALEVHLLPEGRRRVQAIEAVNQRVTDEFFSPLTAGERDVFHRLLTKLAGRPPTKE
ncbi:Multidrug resistance operon repressor [Actinomadura rubteroloni]|uniref:Multidrug resistance operon repressor n=1 Tax=Actinomadura rubteroloni TaxID=1926885 RepID=A0A2P4UDA5_9ACTN|nr:MarR family transcriptional regulator [Actinomadura rubteroloni]POM23040.1 Multidrug resistance operon repressor [Actinomadura rubteroloni]